MEAPVKLSFSVDSDQLVGKLISTLLSFLPPRGL